MRKSPCTQAHRTNSLGRYNGIIKVNLSPTCDVFWGSGPSASCENLPKQLQFERELCYPSAHFPLEECFGEAPEMPAGSHGTRQTTGPWLRRRQLVVGFQACRFQDILNSQSGSQCNFRWGPHINKHIYLRAMCGAWNDPLYATAHLLLLFCGPTSLEIAEDSPPSPDEAKESQLGPAKNELTISWKDFPKQSPIRLQQMLLGENPKLLWKKHSFLNGQSTK